MSKDFSSLSLSLTAALVRSGKIDLRQLFDFHSERIKQFNPAVRALRINAHEEALKQIEIRSNEIKNGICRGRLHGMLFTAKDTVPVAGLPRSDGSLIGSHDNIPNNSSLVAKLINEGAICIGKSNMAEYGKSYYTDNPIFGRTFNPFDLKLSPGGSGGGDSAAIACDFAQFGIGADAGGSVRVPANFCGLFGLFPTRGLFSDGGLTCTTHTFAKLFRSAGVIAKSIDDIEILFSILKGYDPLDAASVTEPIGIHQSKRKENARFAYFSQINAVDCDPEIKSSLLATVKKLSDNHYSAEEHTPPACAGTYELFIILAGQANLLLEDILAKESGKPRELEKEGAMMKNLRKRIASELPPLTVESLLKCWQRVDVLRAMIAETFLKYEFIICPVAATLPPAYDTSLYKIDGKEYQSQQVFQFASMVNLLGLPAIAFPTGKSKNGLPVGLQIIGPRFSEKKLISVIREFNLGKRVLPDLMQAN